MPLIFRCPYCLTNYPQKDGHNCNKELHLTLRQVQALELIAETIKGFAEEDGRLGIAK